MMASCTFLETLAKIMGTLSMRPKFMARSGKTDERVLAKLGGSVLGHNWNATDDLLSFTLVVDIANKKDKAKGLNKIITKDNLEKLKKIKLTKR
jgi:hypothetical protein